MLFQLVNDVKKRIVVWEKSEMAFRHGIESDMHYKKDMNCMLQFKYDLKEVFRSKLLSSGGDAAQERRQKENRHQKPVIHLLEYL